MKFYPVDWALQDVHARYWAATPVHTADCTFVNLWGWAEEYGLEWAEAHDLLWIRRTRRGGMPASRLWMPLGDWNTVDWQAVLADTEPGTIWDRVPEALCTKLAGLAPDRVHIEETRGQWEYLYNAEALARLSGNKLHKKRNHVNGFIKAYGEDYRSLGPDDLETLLLFEHDWCHWHECLKSPALAAENEAVLRVLPRWERLPGLLGGALYVEGQMVAFCVGEALDEKTLVVHFEKGHPDYRGVYQAINMFFAQQAGAKFELINREQDAGEDGLRQAKQSYCPCGFLVKNRICFS